MFIESLSEFIYRKGVLSVGVVELVVEVLNLRGGSKTDWFVSQFGCPSLGSLRNAVCPTTRFNTEKNSLFLRNFNRMKMASSP